MKNVIKEGNQIPIKMWLDTIEDEALNQARNLSKLPFARSHIAIMPDSHVGYGMPIGAILATQDVVVPNAVGVDIGCGMCAQSMGISELSKEDLKNIMGLVRKVIPLGFSRHAIAQDENLMPKNWQDLQVVKSQYNSALKQIGSLGGGNHFIEIQSGSDGQIWVMIHSGSRNLGLKVANFYNEKAKKLNAKYFSSVPANWDLAFLPIQSVEAHDYLKEMQYCVDFALANRKLMMQRVIDAFYEVLGEVIPGELLNKSHNFAAWENHFSQNLLVHRKGATRAFEGELGMIPGSMGTKSFIVKGKGNPESFKSCSHGAGRKLGRKQAIRELDLEKQVKLMEDRGIVHGLRSKKELDEAPGAYKDIDEVMKNQSDLVDVVVELKPLGVIKG